MADIYFLGWTVVGNCITLICCDIPKALCDPSFSGCLFVSILFNLGALIYGIVCIIQGFNSDDCGKPLVILLLLLFACCVINISFSYYMWHSIRETHTTIPYERELVSQSDTLINASNPVSNNRVYGFCKQNIWMAVYMILLIGMIALIITCLVMTIHCRTSTIGQGVFYSALIMTSYIVVSTLIVLSYSLKPTLKEIAQIKWCYFIPCCWPCVCIGACLNKRDRSNRGKI
eukprot:383862_1